MGQVVGGLLVTEVLEAYQVKDYVRLRWVARILHDIGYRIPCLMLCFNRVQDTVPY